MGYYCSTWQTLTLKTYLAYYLLLYRQAETRFVVLPLSSYSVDIRTCWPCPSTPSIHAIYTISGIDRLGVSCGEIFGLQKAQY